MDQLIESLGADTLQRLAALGITPAVIDRIAFTAFANPPRPEIMLHTAWGTVGLVSQLGAFAPGGKWYVGHNATDELQFHGKALLDARWHGRYEHRLLLAQHLDMFEELAARLVTMGLPREHAGEFWAFHLMLENATDDVDPTPVTITLEAFLRLLVAHATRDTFQRHFDRLASERDLYRVTGEERLMRALVPAEFEAASGTHPSLVAEMFA